MQTPLPARKVHALVLPGLRFLILAAVIFAWFHHREASAQTDMPALKQRIFEYRSRNFTPTNWAPPTLSYDPAVHLASQNATNGSWADIAYIDTPTGTWKAWEHLMRVEIMAAAARNVSSPHYGSTALLDAAELGLDHWLTRNPTTIDDEWSLAIGRNMSLASITILLEDRLDQTQKDKLYAMMYRAIIPVGSTHEYRFGGNIATGQNRIWIADIHAQCALLKGSASELNTALGAIKSVAAISSTNEGVKADYSFLQHGPQLNIGAYGKAFMWDTARWIYVTRGLSYAYSDAQLTVVRNYVLDGWQWVFRRGAWDPMVLGRQIARDSYRNMATFQEHRVLQEMQVGDPAYAAQYGAFLSHLQGTNDSSLVGNKQFWCADYMVHRRSKFSFHIRSTSNRTCVSEVGSYENVQNKYQSEGGNQLLLTGTEYNDVQPVMRWDQFPGVTAPNKNPAPTTPNLWEHWGTQSFVGGASNGVYGVHAKDLNCDGVTGRKTWFCFDDDIVCLGAGINYTQNLQVRTALNQTVKNGDVYVEYGTGAGTIAAVTGTTPATLVNPKWAYHDNVGYIFPTTANVELRNQPAAPGNWYWVNRFAYPNTATTTRDLFGLSISHAVNPVGATYAYILVPGQTKAFVQSYAATPQSRIIQNSPTLQAVRNDVKKVAGVVFWSAGQVVLSPALTVSVNQNCILLIDESSSPMKVSVSRYSSASPATAVAVTLDFASQPDQVLNFTLPTGGNVGRTLTQNVTVLPPPGVTLEPAADAHVRDGSYATINYGLDPLLQVKSDASSYRREAYIKFNLPGLTQPVTSAKLRIPVVSGDTTTLALHRVPSDTWTELGIVWNNRPTTGLTSLGTFQAVPGQTREIDITGTVSSEMSGDKVLTVRIAGTQTPLFSNLGSRDNTTVNLRPTLVVTH